MLKAIRSYAAAGRNERDLRFQERMKAGQGSSSSEDDILPGVRRSANLQMERRRSQESRWRDTPKKGSEPGKVKASVVAEPEGRKAKSPPPIGERAAKAAAFVFRACDSTRTGTLLRWQFASAVEMMMRQKLVPYLIEQVRAAAAPAALSSDTTDPVPPFARAEQRLTRHPGIAWSLRRWTRRDWMRSFWRHRRAQTSARLMAFRDGSKSLTCICSTFTQSRSMSTTMVTGQTTAPTTANGAAARARAGTRPVEVGGGVRAARGSRSAAPPSPEGAQRRRPRRQRRPCAEAAAATAAAGG
jgi:hypothetical protein